MKFCCFIILLCITKYSSANDWKTSLHKLEISEEPDARGSKIVNGLTSTTFNQFPYQCLIFITRSPTLTVQCGASLISDRWIISAKHCVKNATGIEVRIGGNGRQNYVIRTFASAFASTDFADVTLIQLRTQITLSKNIIPIRLPRLSQINSTFVGLVATVSGYGIENQAKNSLSNFLQYTTVKIITNEECSRTFGSTSSLALCAVGFPNSNSSTCQGDSGGPIAINENGIPTLVGVVSYGAAIGCDLGYPVGFFRTAAQLKWITSYTGITLRP